MTVMYNNTGKKKRYIWLQDLLNMDLNCVSGRIFRELEKRLQQKNKLEKNVTISHVKVTVFISIKTFIQGIEHLKYTLVNNCNQFEISLT